jgi:GH35 family endo-1,4-beta-xylanase
MGTKPEKVRFIKKLRSQRRSLDEIRVMTFTGEETIKKYISMKEDVFPAQKQTVRGREHDEAVEKVRKRAIMVRELKEQGLSLEAISGQSGFTYATVKRCCNCVRRD